MQYRESIRTLNKFVDKLQDSESEHLFDARFTYFVNRDKDVFYENLDNVLSVREQKLGCGWLSQYYDRNPVNREAGIIIFGAGEMGKLTCRSLLHINRKIDCICDNNENLHGLEYRSVPIMGFAQAHQSFKKDIVIVAAAPKHQIEIYHQLISLGIRESDIVMSDYGGGGLYCDIAGQYFDLPAIVPDKDGEYFVDAGCFNGGSSIQCKEWCRGNLKMVYAFEPDRKNYQNCRKNLSNLGCEFEVYEAATWSEKDTLRFRQDTGAGWGSAVDRAGEVSIEADSIDNKLHGRKATYIKMDVEGSELEALEGSIKTIRKYRPKLAISLYHKPEDIIEIPIFLEKLDLGYQYYIRHYQTRMEETVLYAVP